MTDPFWFNKTDILFDKKRISQFWPSKYQTYEERVNAMTRFILYAGTILSFYKHDSSPFVMSILLVVVLVFTSKSKNKFLQKLTTNLKNCQNPTTTNPLANQIPFDSINRKKACSSSVVENQITDSLFSEFPTKGLSNMNKDFIERQFFSMPNTDLVNNQSGFASWLYGDPNRKMCKSDPQFCTGFQGQQNSPNSK
jgi:hypothetical protein